jgi:hypothetical protein
MIRVSRVNIRDKDCLPEHANAYVSSFLKDSGHIKTAYKPLNREHNQYSATGQ